MSRHVILYVYNNSTVSLDSLVYVLGGPRDVGNLPLTSQITWSTMNHLSAGWYSMCIQSITQHSQHLRRCINLSKLVLFCRL